MGETLSTCAGGEDHNNNNNKFNKPKFSLKKNNNNVTATRKTKATSHSNNANSSDSDNPFQQYERERISKQALVSKKIDAKEEYELEIAKANQENNNDDSSIPNKNNKTAILNKARKKYIIKLIKIKELASINFQYTLVKQIELEIEAVKKVGGRNIIGNEEFLNVPLEVPKVSFELKEIKIKTPTKDVVHNNVNVNNNKEQQQMKNNNNNNNNNNGSMEDDDDVEEKEIRKKTIKEFPPKIIQPSSTTSPSSHLHQQQPSAYQHQYLTFEEKRNQVWKEDINLRMKKKKEVKSNLHHLLQRQQEKNGTMTTKKV